jgi:cell wall-associated protease
MLSKEQMPVTKSSPFLTFNIHFFKNIFMASIFRNNNLLTIIIVSIAVGISPLHSSAQSTDKYSQKNWQLMDLKDDSVYGTSVNKAYSELLKDKKPHRVIVAVIDAGLDTAHEDLQGHIWTNKKEIAGNGIDDDHNGYADDIHGWNFLGGKNGNITSESLESYREYYRLHLVYSGITDSTQVPAGKRKEYQYWLKLQQRFNNDSSKTAASIVRTSALLATLKSTDSTWENLLHKDTLYITDIKTAVAADSIATSRDSLAKIIMKTYATRHFADNMSLETLHDRLSDGLKSLQERIKNFSIDPNADRKQIVGDDPFNINDKHYGNNNVAAGVPSHGTHVAGIIAAGRNNGIGMDGITNDVLIMPIRAVPDGDERDKDIALAIRYAVDNGAEVINMSFGKPFSPGKKWVDDAVKYADSKDVLIIHAAGNDNNDLDTAMNFPSAVFLNSTAVAPNIITIGASTGGPDSLLAASFSNYGQKRVDVFAPGQNVYSTIPGNKYASYSGTSMASPVVAGIAALILEYYPDLTAEQVKYVIEHSVVKFPGLMVKKPGSDTMVPFSSLSVTGGIVNAYDALKLAATIKGKRYAAKK